MEIIENRALLLRTRLVDRILETIPKSELLGALNDDLYEVLVHWGPTEVNALKSIGFKNVPPAPLRKYDWPGMYKPMSHQITTSEFLVAHPKAFVLSDAGTGKTGAICWAADYLMRKGLIKKVLIVCPVSIMYAAWQHELFRILMHRTVGVAHGSQEVRKKVVAQNYEFTIINYDGVETILKTLEGANFDLIIADEATALKNSMTKRWKAFNKLVRPETRLWMMTGTPAAQSPEDAYGLAKLVSPEKVPKFFGGWKNMVMQKVSQFQYIPKPRAKELVYAALQPAIRYTQEECIDLPGIVYQMRDVPMSAQQTRFYNEMKRRLMFEADGEEVTAVNAATKLNKLLQISCGAIYSDDGEVLRFEIGERLNVLEEVVLESEKKTIVFAPYRHTIELIQEFLNKKSIPTAVINGDVGATKRGHIIKDFQNTDKIRVVVIQPQAAAHGITLTAASTVVWFGPTSSVEYYLQANARAYRKGQENKVRVIKLCSSEAERKTFTMLEHKIEGHLSIVDLYKDIVNG